MLKFKTIRSKLISAFILIVVIPTIVISIVAFRLFRSNMENALNRQVIESLKMAANSIDNIIFTMISASNSVVIDEDVISILSKDSLNNNNFGYNDFNRLVQKATNIQSTFFIDNTSLITITDLKGSVFRSWEGVSKDYFLEFSKKSWFGDTLKLDGYMLWTAPFKNFDGAKENSDEYYIMLSRLIKGNRTSGGIGMVLLNIKESDFYNKVFGSGGETSISESFLINSEGVVISHKNKKAIGDKIKNAYVDKVLLNENGSFVVLIGNNKSLVNYFTVNRTGWKIIQVTDDSELFDGINRVRNVTAIIIFLFLNIFTLVTVLVITAITNPIKSIKDLMKKVEEGNFDLSIDIRTNDEIEELGDSFNSMIKKTKSLINQVKVEQIRKEQLKLEALQAQINPHFLFNTLNTIKWTAILNQDESVANMLSALGGVLQLSMGASNEMINLGQEIEALKDYVYIQKIRYNKRFNITYEVNEKFYEFKILKLILQPIVENSITHAFGELDNCIDISLKARRVNDNLLIEIKDNGVGITKERANRLLENKRAKNDRQLKFNGIGLKNVNDRIKIHFGDNYGLQIESEVGVFTIVKVLVPIIFEEDF